VNVLPPYAYVAQLNGWGRKVKIHRWGCQIGHASIVWWDLWSGHPCLEISRVRGTIHMFDTNGIRCGGTGGQITHHIARVTCPDCQVITGYADVLGPISKRLS